jgi:Bacteriophage tail sheath protein
MPEYLAPGVYVEEVDTGNKPIEGVATSTAGFLGICERGPLKPTLVTSFSEYTRLFGRYVANRFLPYAVEGFFQNGGKRCFIMRIAPAGWAVATIAIDNLVIDAIGPGAWANNRVAVKVSQAGLTNPNVPGSDQLFKLTIMYWDLNVANLPTPPLDPTDPANLRNPDLRIPTVLESYDNLSADPLSSSFYVRRVNNRSTLVTVQPNDPTDITRPGDTAALSLLDNGTEADAVTLADVEGDPAALPGNKRGLAALEEVDEVAILACPEENDSLPGIPNGQIADKLVEQCERLKDRFTIIESSRDAGSITNLRPSIVSKYAAFYFPWLRIVDPLTQKELEIPPCGHIAGIYARSDIERGVHKAPANEIIRGLLVDIQDPARGLQFNVPKGQQDLLNPRGVNVLRNFVGRGNLVWGARTTTLDPDWKYVNVRRLFIFVEESIDEATQWVVFEPNDEPLWARVRRSVSEFLTRLWMDGMLQGKTREEAYFVRCDRTTMTQGDIDNGRLIVLVGMAPVKPAEFVIFRIGQWAGGSDISEG